MKGRYINLNPTVQGVTKIILQSLPLKISRSILYKNVCLKCFLGVEKLKKKNAF